MEFVLLSARVVHVLLGVFWAGAVFFLMIYLEPAIREVGPDGGKVMASVQRRGFNRVLSWVGLFNLLTGMYLLWAISGGFSSGFMGSRSGMLLSTGMLAGILALGVGIHMTKPTAERLASLGSHVASLEGPPAPDDLAEMDRLRGKLRAALRIGSALLLAALAAIPLAAHRVPTHVIELEDSHVDKAGGELYPEAWVPYRPRFRGGWRMVAGDSVSMPIVAGGTRLAIDVELMVAAGTDEPGQLSLRTADRELAVRSIDAVRGWQTVTFHGLEWADGATLAVRLVSRDLDSDAESTVILDRVTLLWD